MKTRRNVTNIGKLKLRKAEKRNYRNYSLGELFFAIRGRLEEWDHDYKGLMRYFGGSVPFTEDPIRVQEMWGKGRRWVPCLMQLGYVMGVGVVYRGDGGHITVIGREHNLVLWNQFAGVYRDKVMWPENVNFREVLMELQWDVADPHISSYPSSLRPARLERMAPVWITHKVAELFPELIDETYDGPDEVRLLPAAGAMRAGGIVQPYSYYSAGLHEKGMLRADATLLLPPLRGPEFWTR